MAIQPNSGLMLVAIDKQRRPDRQFVTGKVHWRPLSPYLEWYLNLPSSATRVRDCGYNSSMHENIIAGSAELMFGLFLLIFSDPYARLIIRYSNQYRVQSKGSELSDGWIVFTRLLSLLLGTIFAVVDVLSLFGVVNYS